MRRLYLQGLQYFDGWAVHADILVDFEHLSGQVGLPRSCLEQSTFDFLEERGFGWAAESILADLEVGFEDEEGICMHGWVADADDGGVGDVDSEEDIDLRHHSDSFRQREGQPPPLELHRPILQFDVGQVEEGVVPSMSIFSSLGELVGVCVIVQGGDGESGRQVDSFHCYKIINQR